MLIRVVEVVVMVGAALLVTERFVCRRNFEKLILVPTAIGMVSECQLAVRALDLLCRRIPGHTEYCNCKGSNSSVRQRQRVVGGPADMLTSGIAHGITHTVITARSNTTV